MAIYSIYKWTNQINGKVYVGQTSKDPLKRKARHSRNASSGKKNALYFAMRKYGQEAFCFDVICCTNTKKNANDLEKYFIAQYKSYTLDGGGYNMTRGGDGFDSDTCRRNAMLRISKGTHPFAGSRGRTLQQQRIEDGTHPLAGERGCELQKRRMNDGTHHLLAPDYHEKARKRELQKVADGTHPFTGTIAKNRAKEIALKRIAEGSHNLAGVEGKRRIEEQIKAGTHCSQVTHVCPACGRSGKGNYFKGRHFDRCKD